MHTWKKLMGAVLLVAAMAAPATAADPTIADVLNQMKKLSDDLAANGKLAADGFSKVKADMDKFNGEITLLRGDLESLRKDLEGLRAAMKTEQVRGAGYRTELDELRHRVDDLQTQCQKQSDAMRRAFSYTPPSNGSDSAYRTEVDELRHRFDQLQAQCQRQSDTMRRAFSYTPPSGGSDSALVPAPLPPPPPPATGTILLRNFSDVNGTFVINGQPYAVMAGQVMEVRNVPAGTFGYQIEAQGFGVIRTYTSRSLPAGGTFTLNIDPRPQAVVVVP
jgi:polyhydroxyalkanoate synthesis regulator phasin